MAALAVILVIFYYFLELFALLELPVLALAVKLLLIVPPLVAVDQLCCRPFALQIS